MIIISALFFIMSISIVAQSWHEMKKELEKKYNEGFKDGANMMAERIYYTMTGIKQKKETDRKNGQVQ